MGKPHSSKCWRWLKEELVERFGGWSAIPGVEGAWKSPRTGKAIADQSIQYTVAVADQKLGEVRMVLRKACIVFAQQCIYLSIAGRVEFARTGMETTKKWG